MSNWMDLVQKGQNLTVDTNVGGFDQNEAEIVLQNANRISNGTITVFTNNITSTISKQSHVE